MKNKSLFLILKHLLKHYKSSIIKFVRVSSYVKISWTALKYIYRFSYWSIAGIISFLAAIVWELGDLQEAIIWIISFKDQLLIQFIQFLRNLLSDNAAIKLNKIIKHVNNSDVIKIYDLINSPTDDNDEFYSDYSKYIYYTLFGITLIIVGGLVYKYQAEIVSTINSFIDAFWAGYSNRGPGGGTPGAASAAGDINNIVNNLPVDNSNIDIKPNDHQATPTPSTSQLPNNPLDTPKASTSKLPTDSATIFANDDKFPGSYDNLQKSKGCILPQIPDDIDKGMIKLEDNRIMVQGVDEAGNKGDWFDPSSSVKSTNSAPSDTGSLKSKSSFKKGLSRMFK